jgi:hypothetical protein
MIGPMLVVLVPLAALVITAVRFLIRITTL